MILVNTVKNHKEHKKTLLKLIDDFEGLHDTEIKNLQTGAKHQATVSNISSDWSLDKETKRDYLDYFYNHVIKDTMNNFGYLLGLSYSEWQIINGWYMRYSEHGENSWHNHLTGHFTNVYFLELPDSSYKTEVFGRDGKIIEYEAKEGDVMSCPTWMLHRSQPNGPKRKTTILFNSSFEFTG